MIERLVQTGLREHKFIRAGALAAVTLVLGSAIGLAVILAGSRIWILLALLGVAALTAIVFFRPEWGIWLIPVTVAAPRTLPRLFGRLGAMELALGFLLGIVILRSLLLRKRIEVDSFLGVLLLAATPAALSLLAGRGQYDGTRLYNWLGSCLVYFAVINLMRPNKSAYYVLLGFPLIVMGLILADFLLFSGVPLPETDYEWHTYRSLASTIGGGIGAGLQGQANFVVSLATAVFPIPIAYGLFAKRQPVRLLCVALIIANLSLAVLVQTRAFVFSAAMALVAMLIPAWRRLGIRFIWVVVIILLVGILAVWYLLPGGWVRLVERVTATGVSEGRIEIWQTLLEGGWRSPIFGQGAIGDEATLLRFGTRSGHGLFPQIFFEYGIVFVLPVVGLLAAWLRRSLRLLRISPVTVEDQSIALAHWGIVIGLLANALLNDHLVLTASYSALAFSLAALVAAQGRWVKSRANAEG
jgi:hypothetical protein